MGQGSIRVRAHRDGTVDHDHQIAWPSPQDHCVKCGLPVEDWPPVVIAKWWPSTGEWAIYWPKDGQQLIGGHTRRKAQNEARRLILAKIPNARIKWTAV